MKRHGMEQVKGNYQKEGGVQSTLNVLLGSGTTMRRNPRSATDAQQIIYGNASAIVAMVPICMATLMAMVPLELYLKDLAADRVRDRHLSRTVSPRTRVPSASGV